MSWKFTLSLFVTLSLGIVQLSGQTCGDVFYDSGGPDGNYSNNEGQTFIICPDNPGDLVTLTFTFVDVESCCDPIGIYNGGNLDSPINLDVEDPETFTSSAADGCLTMTWFSDGSVTNGGWAATVGCAPPPPCPNPESIVISDITASGATFSWAQVGDVTVWDVEIVATGEMPTGTPTISNITDNPYTWDGGESGTSYDFYLRGQCADGEEFTNWVGPFSFGTIPGCGDSFFDSGGPDGDYQNNEFQTWVFCPDNPGDLVVLDFTFVSVESCCDDLMVFSGADASIVLNGDLEVPETFTSLSADGCLTVTWDSDFSVVSGGWEATVDCIVPPECADPSDLIISDVTSASAMISWGQIGPVMTWDLEVVPAGTPPTGTPTITGVTDNPYELTGLDSGTAYDVYVRGQCEGDEPFTNWVGPSSFTTIPGCGDSFFDSGGPDGPYQDNEFETFVFCPDSPGDLVVLDFTFVEIETPFDNLQIFSGADASILLEESLEAPATFTSLSADGCLTVIFDSDGVFAFEGWEATIDCTAPPECAAPLFLTTTNVTSSSVVLGWTQIGPPSVWDIEVVPAGTPPTGVPTVTDITDNPYLLEGLESGTEYDFYVRGQCAGDEPFTEWAGPASFRTSPGCGDSFFDSGGPDENYQSNELETWIFCPDTPGDIVVLDFSFVNVESGWDFLMVYSGADASVLLNDNVLEPSIFTSESADGCLTVTWDSDGSVTRPGWEATVNCVPCVPEDIIFTENVTVDFFGATTADIAVELLGENQQYLIEYDTLGFEIGTGNIVNGTDELTSLSDLEENTAYEFYLTNICEDGTESIRVGPFFFTTIYTNDIGITGLVTPDDDCGLGLGEAILVEITNFGADPQTLFPLNFSVNGEPSGVSQPTDGFYTGIISRDSTRTFEFDLTYDFTLPGEYIIQIWTDMMNDSDLNNDTFTIVLNRFAPPLYEDFENGIPAYMTIAGNTFLAAPFDHNNATNVLSANLFGDDDEFILDLPVLGPIEATDTLFFDYRYVDWQPGTVPTTNLTAEDFLSVLVSVDCGENFGIAFLQPGTSHEPSATLRTVAVPLANFEGENILIRIAGAYGSGGFDVDYWLDVDNINLRRCQDFTTNAIVDNPTAGMDDGQIILLPEGGVGPFDIMWNTGETTDTLSNLEPGEYSVTITDRGGCSASFTFLLESVNTAEISDVLIGDLQLVPNPAPDQTRLRVNFADAVDARIEVMSTLGQRMWQSPIFENVSNLNEQIDISQLPDGIYFIQVHAAGQSKTVRLMKTQ
ncbi:MAG: fibronectin type III domain-containing protein [Bacteroidota bacterium]